VSVPLGLQKIAMLVGDAFFTGDNMLLASDLLGMVFVTSNEN